MTADQPELTVRVVCGIELTLVATADGGRQTALVGGSGADLKFKYRPNWGLPGMAPPGQSGAMVFGFSRLDVSPGTACRAVIVQLAPVVVEWQLVHEGLVLPCYEGNRVVGYGRVLWRENVDSISYGDEIRWWAWLDSTGASSGVQGVVET